MVRIRDESRWRSDLNFPTPSSPTLSSKSTDEERELQRREQFQHHKQHQQDPFFASGGKPPPALEARILAKIEQVRELGQLGGACSQQTLFPGDRFGRITRGQFRQSLVHLGVLARYAEVEALFWTLDPTGRGYMISRDLYDHLGAFAASQTNRSDGGDAWKHLIPAVSTDSRDASSLVSVPRLARSVQKVLERMLLDFPNLFAICERCDIQKIGTVSPPQLLSAIQELGILASVADTQTAIAALCPKIDPASSSSALASSIAIPYRTLDRRLAQLCSDLLSPKKRKKMHLSTASVLLAPHEQLYSERLSTSQSSDYDMNTMSETDALWNCPRRRMNQSHRATKTSVHIGDGIQTDDMSADNNNWQSDTIDRGERRRLLAIIGIIHDVLERRSDLKTVMDLHRSADAHGQVTKQDLIEILMTSRLNLDFETGGISAAQFVNALYPPPAPSSPLARNANTRVSVGFLDLLHRCSDLLSESTRTLQISQSGAAIPSQKQQQRQAARRLNSTVALGMNPIAQDYIPDAMLPAMYSTSLLQPQHQRDRSATTYGTGSLEEEPSPTESIRRKLLGESRLKDLLWSDEGRRSAAVLVRHAFKGLAPREMVVPVENGEFEAMCRASDLKHACYRLGLDLDPHEQSFMARALDASGSGFISSPQVHQFLVHLARTAQEVSSSRDKLSESRVRWGDVYEDNNRVDLNDGQYSES